VFFFKFTDHLNILLYHQILGVSLNKPYMSLCLYSCPERRSTGYPGGCRLYM
jgi:hypothetical protein